MWNPFKKECVYYVTYYFKDEKEQGTGVTKVEVDRKITSVRDIEEIERWIKTITGATKVGVSDWKMLKK